MSDDRIAGTLSSVAMKPPCRVATTANITLEGLQAIDGVTVAADDRVLVKNQTDTTENGIYLADSSEWGRALDFDGARDVVVGTLVRIISGSTNADSYWAVSIASADPVAPGTSALVFTAANASLSGVSAFMQTVLDDTTAVAALTTLGITGFIQTLLDDATASAARVTLGLPGGINAISGNTVLTSSNAFLTQIISATADITLPAASDLSVGDAIYFKSSTTGNVQLLRAGSDTIDGATSYQLPSYCDCAVMKTAALTYVLSKRPDVNVGDVKFGSYGTAETGWLAADATAVSRTTYAGLNAKYNAASYPFGTGDGSTTFNTPDTRSRLVMGVGTGTSVEALASVAASGNGLPVASNSDRYVTGDVVVVSGVSGFGGTITNASYFASRISSTNLRLSTTLALAQAGTPDVTITGTGSVTLTRTFTSRTLAQQGGEEAHAMSITELLAHTHPPLAPGTFFYEGTGGSAEATGGPAALDTYAATTGSTGGNAAMNIMQPYLALNGYVKT